MEPTVLGRMLNRLSAPATEDEDPLEDAGEASAQFVASKLEHDAARALQRRAALTLQTAWRGRSARKVVRRKRRANALCSRATVVVQAWLRATVARREAARRRAKLAQLHAALGLQCVYRGWRHRAEATQRHGAARAMRAYILRRLATKHALDGRHGGHGGLPHHRHHGKAVPAHRAPDAELQDERSVGFARGALLAALARAHAFAWPRLTLDLRGQANATSNSASALSPNASAGAGAGAGNRHVDHRNCNNVHDDDDPDAEARDETLPPLPPFSALCAFGELNRSVVELQLDDCAVSSTELCTLCPLVESAVGGDGVLRVLRLEGNHLLRTTTSASADLTRSTTPGGSGSSDALAPVGGEEADWRGLERLGRALRSAEGGGGPGEQGHGVVRELWIGRNTLGTACGCRVGSKQRHLDSLLRLLETLCSGSLQVLGLEANALGGNCARQLAQAMQAPECQLRQLFVGENPMVDCGRDARAVQSVQALACACAASGRCVALDLRSPIAAPPLRFDVGLALADCVPRGCDTCAEAKEEKDGVDEDGDVDCNDGYNRQAAVEEAGDEFKQDQGFGVSVVQRPDIAEEPEVCTNGVALLGVGRTMLPLDALGGLSRHNDPLRHRQQTDPCVQALASIPTNVSYRAARAPLEELVLHNACLGSGGCYIVATLLSRSNAAVKAASNKGACCRLKRLEMVRCAIAGTVEDEHGFKLGVFDTGGVRALATALTKCRVLHTLDVTGNGLCGCDVYGRGKPDCSALAALLRAARECSGLSELTLSDNWLGTGESDATEDAAEIDGLRQRLGLDMSGAGGADASSLLHDSDVAAGFEVPRVKACVADGSARKGQNPAVAYSLKAHPAHFFA